MARHLMDAELKRIVEALQATPTGLGLLGAAVVLPLTGSARTDTVGVPNGAVNVYRNGGQRVLQVFDAESASWFEWTSD